MSNQDVFSIQVDLWNTLVNMDVYKTMNSRQQMIVMSLFSVVLGMYLSNKALLDKVDLSEVVKKAEESQK